MAASNYDDVLSQLRGAGLIVDTLETGRTTPKRVKVEGGGREKRGWYALHELSTNSGDVIIVGSFGVWRGNDDSRQKVAIRKSELDTAQAAALKKRIADDIRRAEAIRKRDAARAAERASAAWAKLSEAGTSDYLDAKRVQGYGLRYTPNGSAVLPLLDTQAKIHGLQFLRTHGAAEKAKRPAKEFWPAGLVKKGHFHLIGSPSWIVLVAEGYATAATLHMATGHPVAVAFDAGNLLPVAEALRARYRDARILVCADNDDLGKCIACKARLALPLHPTNCPACGEPHRYSNAGVSGATNAALAVSGEWLAPAFADPDARLQAWLADGRSKPTDFNDLHVAEGLHLVRVQVEAKLSELKWAVKTAAPSTTTSGGGAARLLKPIQSVDEVHERFSLVYAHQGAVFDHAEHILMSLSDMREACTDRFIHKSWSASPDRRIVRIREVGFDPTGRDEDITCNLYAGWPTTPDPSGSCEKILDLLRYLCSADRDPRALYEWVLRWLAYPIQHPGAKMKSTVVVHGPQGAGKNIVFESVMKIYGEYGDVLDQSAVEDKFNDWASRKLFMIADEVVARADVYHIKNKLKALITGDRIRINPKNFSAYWERNHLNLVFLSNENMPVVLEEDDRRHCVIWTPPKLPRDAYLGVLEEIRNGGIAALHHYLLHVDLGDFDAGAHPPNTAAKQALIDLGLDSPIRFHDDLLTGDIPKVAPMPARSDDWYELYKLWCNRKGYRAAPQSKFVVALDRQRGVQSVRKRYMPAGSSLGPHSFLMFTAADPPPEGRSEVAWLGDCHTQFVTQLDEYRGMKP